MIESLYFLPVTEKTVFAEIGCGIIMQMRSGALKEKMPLRFGSVITDKK
jgi:hypothetical protein